jgi:hypothetical protein
MGYKVLGFIVWKGAKMYLGRRFGPHAGMKGVVAGAGLALATTALVVGLRRLTSGD